MSCATVHNRHVCAKLLIINDILGLYYDLLVFKIFYCTFDYFLSLFERAVQSAA